MSVCIARSRKTLKHAPVILIVFVLLILAGCQSNGPKIEVTPAEQNLGLVQQKELNTTYTVRNRGNSLLKIDKVSTSCDCTKATLDRTEIPPGETAQLLVHMDPALLNLYGKIQRDIILESNDPHTPKAKVVFRVEIQKPSIISPVK